MDFASVAAAPSTAGSTVAAECETAAGFHHAAFVLGAAPRALLIAQVDLHSVEVSTTFDRCLWTDLLDDERTPRTGRHQHQARQDLDGVLAVTECQGGDHLAYGVAGADRQYPERCEFHVRRAARHGHSRNGRGVRIGESREG